MIRAVIVEFIKKSVYLLVILEMLDSMMIMEIFIQSLKYNEHFYNEMKRNEIYGNCLK